MQKLELQQVIGYVPYDLEIVASDVNHDEAKFVVIGIHQKMFTVIDNEEQSDEVYHFEMSEAKPLLIPLHAITELNPLTKKPYFIEILKVSCNAFMGKNNKFWEPTFSDYPISEGTKAAKRVDIDNEFNDYSFSIDLLNGDLTAYYGRELDSTDNQAAYIEGLYKYHFDVHSLISKGLALNKLDYDV